MRFSFIKVVFISSQSQPTCAERLMTSQIHIRAELEFRADLTGDSRQRNGKQLFLTFLLSYRVPLKSLLLAMVRRHHREEKNCSNEMQLENPFCSFTSRVMWVTMELQRKLLNFVDNFMRFSSIQAVHALKHCY